MQFLNWHMLSNKPSDKLITEAEKVLRRELDSITLKSVNEVLREYQDILERYVVDTVNGNMLSGEMSRAHKKLLKRLAPDAYTEGMKEGGIRDPEAEMEDEDDEAIENWISGQSEYTLEFARACEEASKAKGDDRTNKRDALLDRVDEWTASLRYLGQRGYLSAKSNLPLTWKVGDTEHCDTCSRLDGQRHRASWYTKRDLVPRQPGSNSLDCKGFNCQCTLISDEGDQIIP